MEIGLSFNVKAWSLRMHDNGMAGKARSDSRMSRRNRSLNISSATGVEFDSNQAVCCHSRLLWRRVDEPMERGRKIWSRPVSPFAPAKVAPAGRDMMTFLKAIVSEDILGSGVN